MLIKHEVNKYFNINLDTETCHDKRTATSFSTTSKSHGHILNARGLIVLVLLEGQLYTEHTSSGI